MLLTSHSLSMRNVYTTARICYIGSWDILTSEVDQKLTNIVGEREINMPTCTYFCMIWHRWKRKKVWCEHCGSTDADRVSASGRSPAMRGSFGCLYWQTVVVGCAVGYYVAGPWLQCVALPHTVQLQPLPRYLAAYLSRPTHSPSKIRDLPFGTVETFIEIL
jgi:hypothetical protein